MPTLDQQQAALVWLNEHFVVQHDEDIGDSIQFLLTAENGLWIIDKEGKRWRLSEVLAAYREESK